MIDLSEHNKKILIVRLGKIGDIIIASAAIESIKNKFPNVEISILTLKCNKEVLKYNLKISHLILTNKNISLYFKLLSLRKNNYDLLIDLNDDPSTTSNLIRKLIKATIKVGFDFEGNRRPDISVTQPPKDKTHIIERVKYLLLTINNQFEDIKLLPKLYLGDKEKNEVSEQIKRDNDKSNILAINLSAGAPIRYWPLHSWVTLLKQILEKHTDWKIILLSVEKDFELRQSLLNELPKERIIPQEFKSFQHYASYICFADILITPDTSAVHISSAFDNPVIALYPNYEWNYISWQPLSKNYRSIKSNSESIADIKVDEVYNAFQEILIETGK